MRPRANTLGLLFHEGCLLLEEQQGIHSQGDSIFYRPIGGTIEFGEHSAAALVREYKEELGAEIDIIRYVGCLENIYAIRDKVFHEITQLHVVAFSNQALYDQEAFTVTEGTKTMTAKWIPIADLHKRETVLYPSGLLELIDQQLPKISQTAYKE